VTVRAGTLFNATGIFVDSGESFLIQANGVVDLSVGNGGYQTDPNGTIVISPPANSGAFQFFRDRAGPLDTNPVQGSRKSFLPLTSTLPGHLPGAPYGALVAGFSTTATPTSFVVQAPNTGGYLFLATNDFDNTVNNAGAFEVMIQDLTPEDTADDVVIEAEDMFLSAGYSIEPGLGRIVIANPANNATGYAHVGFPGVAGNYRIEVQLVSGGTGLSVVEFYLRGGRLGYQYFDYSTQNLKLLLPTVAIGSGDSIILAGNAEGDGGARVDKILFVRQ
jgi:hypothetical protein